MCGVGTTLPFHAVLPFVTQSPLLWILLLKPRVSDIGANLIVLTTILNLQKLFIGNIQQYRSSLFWVFAVFVCLVGWSGFLLFCAVPDELYRTGVLAAGMVFSESMFSASSLGTARLPRTSATLSSRL